MELLVDVLGVRSRPLTVYVRVRRIGVVLVGRRVVGVGALVVLYSSRVSLLVPPGTVVLVGRMAPRHSLALTTQLAQFSMVVLALVMLTTVVALRTLGLLLLTSVLWHRVLMAMAPLPLIVPVGTAKSLVPQVIPGPFSRSLLSTAYRLNITFLGMVLGPRAIPVLVLIGMALSASVLSLLAAKSLFIIPRAQALGLGLGPGLGLGLGLGPGVGLPNCSLRLVARGSRILCIPLSSRAIHRALAGRLIIQSLPVVSLSVAVLLSTPSVATPLPLEMATPPVSPL